MSTSVSMKNILLGSVEEKYDKTTFMCASKNSCVTNFALFLVDGIFRQFDFIKSRDRLNAVYRSCEATDISFLTLVC